MKAEHIEGVVNAVRARLEQAVAQDDAVSFTMTQGVHYSDRGDGTRIGSPNSTLTMTLEINGGAKDTGCVPEATLTANL